MTAKTSFSVCLSFLTCTYLMTYTLRYMTIFFFFFFAAVTSKLYQTNRPFGGARAMQLPAHGRKMKRNSAGKNDRSTKESCAERPTTAESPNNLNREINEKGPLVFKIVCLRVVHNFVSEMQESGPLSLESLFIILPVSNQSDASDHNG